ncbi:pyridoxamine 5'-phosphate oxidase family protein [Microbacterium aurantiacum]|uniref:pyridoxamine 5'-phosphate oxidase family protein n=1 Tax=Microbacterium aurantiacum TaxID=162393 RepID=UPI000C80F03A
MAPAADRTDDLSDAAEVHPAGITRWLRDRPTLSGTAPRFDSTELPDEPTPLFLRWIGEAAAAGVSEPHAATLATVDVDGVPDARTLILKAVDDNGWAFAGPRSSRKGDQLAANPVAALNFWWQPVVRAVRVRGLVTEASQEESDADLAARSPAARDAIPRGGWVLWRLAPTRVEFWQGSPDRHHTRVVYEPLEDGTWSLQVGASGSSVQNRGEQS